MKKEGGGSGSADLAVAAMALMVRIIVHWDYREVARYIISRLRYYRMEVCGSRITRACAVQPRPHYHGDPTAREHHFESRRCCSSRNSKRHEGPASGARSPLYRHGPLRIWMRSMLLLRTRATLLPPPPLRNNAQRGTNSRSRTYGR